MKKTLSTLSAIVLTLYLLLGALPVSVRAAESCSVSLSYRYDTNQTEKQQPRQFFLTGLLPRDEE